MRQNRIPSQDGNAWQPDGDRWKGKRGERDLIDGMRSMSAGRVGCCTPAWGGGERGGTHEGAGFGPKSCHCGAYLR